MRETLESRLQKENKPTTAVCTMTLELVPQPVSHLVSSKSLIQQGKDTYVFTWMGDKVVNTISAMLTQEGLKTGSYAGVIEIKEASKQSVKDYFNHIFQQGLPSETELAQSIPEKQLEKYDEFLPEVLLNEGYGKKAFNIKKTKQWLALFIKKTIIMLKSIRQYPQAK